MDDQDLKKLANLIDEKIEKVLSPIELTLQSVRNDVESIKNTQAGQQKSLDEVHDAQSLIQRTLDGVHDTQDTQHQVLDEVCKTQASMQRVLDEVRDTHTGSLIKIENTLEGYVDAYRINKDDFKKLDKRVTKIEYHLGLPSVDN